MKHTRNCLVCLLIAIATSATTCTPGNSTPTTGTGPGKSSNAEQDAYISVIKGVSPSVVEIGTDAGLGSGVVYDDKGDIVTNSHVVGQARDVAVTSGDGKRFAGTVVFAYPPDDLAVVRVPEGRFKPAAFADSSKVQVGEIVLALGSPLGLQGSATEGIVSATGRVVSEGANVTLPDTIQTSAAINPGNSGGALVNLDAQVIGIPTLAAVSPSGGAQAPGIGFAIASNRVKLIADQIVRDGRITDPDRAFLGVQTAETSAGGVLVVAVIANGPAAAAGIQVGDLIISVANTPTPSSGELAQVLAALKPGQSVPVEVRLENGTQRKLNVTLGQYPGG
jgi:putative serine protease PepD